MKQRNNLCQRSWEKVVEWGDRWAFWISQSQSAAVSFRNER